MEVVDGTLQLRPPVRVRARMGTVVPPAGSASGCPLPEGTSGRFSAPSQPEEEEQQR